jgi:signal transduction histidine kinase
MTLSVSCPRCNKLVDPQERQCPHCGVDLAIAAVVAERNINLSPVISTQGPIAPEILVPRLGEYLMERGVLTQEQLQETLEYHKQQINAGRPQLFGQLLLELGLVDRETLDQVVTEQILRLQRALEVSNQQLEQRVKERTKELQDALNKLAELNELKSSFISNISHELRTPLTHIKGYLSLLADGSLGELNTEQDEAMQVLLRAESRLEQLIEDLIQFSLMARGELSLNLKPVSANELVLSAYNRMAKIAKVRKVHLTVNMQPDLPMVRADDEKISWVLLQLQDNAIKFTPQNGSVRVDAYDDSGLVTFVVSDTGIGIAENRLAEIFEPFHQLDGSNTRHYGGTGLGLSLAQQIVEAHGAQIKVKSSENKGSRFEFSLPAYQKDHAG